MRWWYYYYWFQFELVPYRIGCYFSFTTPE